MSAQGIGKVGVTRRRISVEQRDRVLERGRAVAAALHMVLRNLKMYDPDNEIFEAPLVEIRDHVNAVVAEDRSFHMTAVGTLLALNGVVVPVDFSALEALRSLSEALKQAGMGGFAVQKPIDLAELRSFLRLFVSTTSEAERERIRGTVALKASAWEEIKAELDRLSEQEIEEGKGLDREKVALALYARALAFARRVDAALAEGLELPPISRATRIVVDLVDLARGGSSHFLGMLEEGPAARATHAANLCMLSILLGKELELERTRLLDLGRAALLAPFAAEHPLRLLAVRPLDAALVRSVVEAREALLPYDEERSVVGRVLRAAAAFDRLTAPRDGQKPLAAPKAVKEMRRDKTLDPILVALLAKVLAHCEIAKLDASGRALVA